MAFGKVKWLRKQESSTDVSSFRISDIGWAFAALFKAAAALLFSALMVSVLVLRRRTFLVVFISDCAYKLCSVRFVVFFWTRSNCSPAVFLHMPVFFTAKAHAFTMRACVILAFLLSWFLEIGSQA